MSRFASVLLLVLAALVAAPAGAQTVPGTVPAASAPQQAALPILLRDATTVSDGVIRLGDLFNGGIPDPGIAVARAPAPGDSVTIDARFLSAVARSYGLAWRPASRFDQVVVTRDSQVVGTDAIRAALAGDMAMRGIDSDVDIRFDGVAPTLRLPVDVAPTILVQQLNLDPQSGRFNAVLVAPADGPPSGRAVLSGRIHALAEVPVPARRLLPGEIVTGDDLHWVQIHADRLTAAHVVDPAAIIGQTPRRPLRAGEPVRLNDLQVAIVMKRGSMVTMVLESERMVITTQGRAMEDGSAGAIVNVMNTTSNRVVKAVVVDPSTVSVSAASAAVN